MITKILRVVTLAYGYLGPIEALVNVGHVPASVRVGLVSSGPVILAVEHFLQGLQNTAKPVTIVHTYTPSTPPAA